MTSTGVCGPSVARCLTGAPITEGQSRRPVRIVEASYLLPFAFESGARL
jgi:hypothetical protein